MRINEKFEITKKEIRTIELTTDDIEELLTRELKLSENACFNWNIGQWVSLDITDTIMVTKGD